VKFSIHPQKKEKQNIGTHEDGRVARKD